MAVLDGDGFEWVSSGVDKVTAPPAPTPTFSPWGTAADAAAATSEIDTTPYTPPFSPWDSTPGSMIGAGAASAPTAPTDNWGQISQPFSPWDTGAGSMIGAGAASAPAPPDFTPDWGVFNTPGQVPTRTNGQEYFGQDLPADYQPPWDPSINPATAREAAYGSASSGFNPVTEIARQGLDAANVPWAGPLSRLAGGVADTLTLGALSGASGNNMDFTDPAFLRELGMAGVQGGMVGLGGGPIKAVFGGGLRNVVGGTIGSTAASEGTLAGLNAYGNTNLPGADIAANPWVQTSASLATGLAGGVAGFKGAEGVGGMFHKPTPELPVVDLPQGPNVVYHGTAGEVGGELRPDAFVTPKLEDAQAFARVQSRLSGEPPVVYAFEAVDGAVRPSSIEGVAAARGAGQVADPALLRSVGASGVPSLFSRLNDETGALDMGAVSDIANAARHGNPVGRGIARVIPGGVEVSAPAVDTTARIGNLLHAPVLEGEYKPEQALRVGRNLERRAASVANTIDAEAAPAWKALGPTFKDKAGNVFLKNVAPSPAEVDAGLPGALAVRVVEKPGEYALTPAQAAAVKKLGDLTGSVANERDALGATVNRLTGEEGDIFQHRKALKNAAGEELNQQGGAGGSRLAIGKDKTRIFDDPIDAVKAGVVYADPKVAFAENVAGGLKKAVNAHVKTLLEPFGETAASRVSPELRAQVEGLRQKVSSLKATGARLGDKTDRIINDFINDPGANLDNLRDVLPVRVGPNAVGKVGVNFGKTRQELNQTLLDIRKQLNDVAPAWRKEIAASKSPAPGRVTIPQNIAPALIGTDFDKRTAARIISQYGGGIRVGDNVLTTSIPGVKRINSLLTPINATLDFSVTLNQLAILGANNKRAFVKNLGNSLADMFNDTRYNAWLADPKVADTAKWVTIYGDAGDQGDFLAKTLQRLPAFGQTQKQFARFGNRMRVDAFNSIEDSAAKSAGRALDDTAKEQIGRAVDRLSGVSMSRATDAERIAQFAPNFFRSIIETTAHAVSDGGLEGQIARQYLKNYAALGAGIVTATALAQNRDLGEVLNPFDKKAWARGEIKLNPNWMTIRVGGQDVNVFGTYDSAMRLLVVGADSAFRAVNEKDVTKLYDALGYAAGTKGSPVVKFVTDLVKRETFTGVNPWNPVELGKRLLPISVQQGVQSAQEGKSPKDIAIETGLSAIGAKSNPVTDFEKKDQQAMDQYGKHWDELSPVEQNALKAVPGSPAATYESTNPEAVASVARRQADSAVRIQQQQQIDNKYIDPKTQLPKDYQAGKDWRDEYNTLRFAANEVYKKDSRDFPFTGQASTDPMRAAMDEWGKVIDANTFGTKTNWDAVDAWEAANPDKANLVQQYLNDPNRPNTDDTPIVTAKKAASKQIGDAGYWQVKDNVWTQLAAQDPTLSKYKTYYDWKDDVTAQVRAQATGAPDTVVATIVDNIINKNPISKVYEKVSNDAETQWVIAHPDVARLAYLWGYLQPTKLEKVAIAAAESK